MQHKLKKQIKPRLNDIINEKEISVLAITCDATVSCNSASKILSNCSCKIEIGFGIGIGIELGKLFSICISNKPKNQKPWLP